MLSQVRRDLASVALAIAEFEPVRMLVRPAEVGVARDLMGSDVEFVECPLDDLWIRDTGPLFVRGSDGSRACVCLNFNGWGEKQAFAQDALVAEFVAREAGLPCLYAELVSEGGCLEVDGEGTALLTRSCTLNPNRNPGFDPEDFEAELLRLLGVRKVVWLPGLAGEDITDGHVDFYARFIAPGLVVAGFESDPESADYSVTRRHLEILSRARDAGGRKLRVELLRAPGLAGVEDDFAAGYVGFYLCNGGLVMQEFGDETADRAARETLQRLFPEREIVALRVDGLAAGGGSVHCATQQEIA